MRRLITATAVLAMLAASLGFASMGFGAVGGAPIASQAACPEWPCGD